MFWRQPARAGMDSEIEGRRVRPGTDELTTWKTIRVDRPDDGPFEQEVRDGLRHDRQHHDDDGDADELLDHAGGTGERLPPERASKCLTSSREPVRSPGPRRAASTRMPTDRVAGSAA